MSSNVGLSTPRGSGTSGYVQRNLSLLKPRSTPQQFSPYPNNNEHPTHKPRKPDQNILNHDRLREIEVKVFELQDQLEEEGELDEEEIEKRTEELRGRLLEEGKRGREEGGGGAGGVGGGGKRQFKKHQVHEGAEAKALESERLRRALGIREDYEEGGHWKRKEERLREGVAGEGK